MGYARSAKVGFRVVSENMDAIDRANDKMDRLIRSSREANNQLSHFGDRMSVQGLTKFEDKCDSLISKSKKLSDNLTSDVDNINNRLKGLADSYRESAKQISKAFSDTSKEARNSFKRLPKEANFKVNTNLKQTSSDIDHANTRVQRFGTKGKSSFDNLSRSGRKTTKSFRNLYDAGSRLSDMGTMVAMAMVPVAAAFKKSADEATNLQNRYVTIKNLIHTGGESSKAANAETKAMQRENNGFALKYGVSPVDMAKGGEDLIRRGYNGKQELGAHEYFLQAARASGDPYLSVVHNAAPALESFGYKNRAGSSVKRMKDYTKLVTNQMAYASDLSATNFSGMGEALKFASQVAHSAHESLASTTAAIGIMSNRGLDGSLAGTGLRKVINAFASPNLSQMSQQGPIMEQYHIHQKDFYNKNGQLKSLPNLLDYIKHQTRNLTSSKKDDFARKFFGTTGQQAGLDLMELTGKKGSRNTNNLRGLTARVGNAQNMYGGKGYDEYLAKKNMKSWQNQIKQFKQFMNVMGLGFTKTVLPFFTKSLHSANKFLDVLIKLPKPMKEVIGFGTATAALGGSAYVTSKLFKGAANLITGNHKNRSVSGLNNMVGMVGRSSKTSRGGLLSNVLTSRHNMLGGKLGKRTIEKNAGEIGSRVTKGGIMRETSTFGKVAGTGVGIGIAASSGFDLYKAIKSKNRKTKFKDFGKSIGTAVGGGVGFFFGGTAGAAVGSMIGNVVGGWAGKAVHKFSKTKMGHKIGKEIEPVTKAFKSAGKGISKSWSSTTKGLKKPFASAWQSISRNFKKVAPIVTKAFSSINKHTKPLQKLWRTTFVRTLGTSIKMFGHLIGGAFKVAGTVLKGIAGVVKGAAKIIGGTFSGINDLVHGRWSKAWKDAKSVFGGFFDVFKSGIDTIGGLAKDVFGTIGKVAGDAVSGIKGLISDLTGGNKGKKHRHKKSKSVASHALGTSGAEMHSHAALVGEGGTELAYTVNGRKARLLGTNGPEITHVKHGERILNHRDTKKVLNGSYGRVLPGYAAGNTKLGSSNSLKSVEKLSKKTVKDYKDLSNGSSKQLDKFSKSSKSKWSNIHKATSKITDSTQKKTVTDYDQLQKGSYKQLVQFDKGNTSKWRNINSDTKHYTNQSKNQAISTYDSMQKGVQKQVNQMQSGVISSGKATATGFGHALGKMDNYAHSAMSNTVHQLNGGIKGIDKVLGQFGGNSSVINAIHYAKGSNGRLAHDQLAILNDAKSGPRQEAIVHQNGSLSLPSGEDTVRYLKRGESVLNGHQVKKLADQGVIPHYAKGSGVSHSELRKIAKANSKNPSGFINKDFNVNVNVKGTDLQKGLTHTSKSASDKYATPWASAGWNVIEGLIKNSVDSNASMVKAMKRYGSGHKYVWGASGPSAFDCSGLVMYALKHAYGIDVPHNSAAQYADTSVFKHISPSSAQPGDALFWGPGSHVGIYEGHGKYYSAFSDRAHPEIGSYPVHGYGGNGQLLAAKIKGVPSGNSSKKSSKKNPLTRLFEKEMGSKALKWIKNNLQVSGGSFGGQMGGSSITKAMIRKAESIMKVPSSIRGKIMSDILKVAISETGNTNEMQKIHDINSANGNPAGGPLQFTKSTFMNYAVAGHKNWASPYDQVLAYLNNSQYKTASGQTTIWGHSKFDWLGSGPHGSRRFANGGWSSVPAIFGEKKGEPEVAINPKRKSADGLIASAINARSKVSNSVFSNESQKKMHKALLENLRKYNPLKGLASHSKPAANANNNVTVNLNMNITVNANDKDAGAKVANDISRQVEEKVQAMFGKMMATREGGTA